MVARLVRDQEARGSNPRTPTIYPPYLAVWRVFLSIPTRDTLFTCIDNYIKAKEIAGREKATLAEYHKFEKHLHEYSLFEKKPVQTITERDVIDYLLYLDTIKKLAANTRRKHYDFLKSVLNKAVRDRIIPANPIAYLDAPRKTPSCAKAMPEELFKRVL